ncbi:hypothetical protein EDC04DRAFT_2612084 [Pisolithus marmoratus]|nr:hypothetical protein EDC04DRAFT_2612084 [Pisolithus marmoratus]
MFNNIYVLHKEWCGCMHQGLRSLQFIACGMHLNTQNMEYIHNKSHTDNDIPTENYEIWWWNGEDIVDTKSWIYVSRMGIQQYKNWGTKTVEVLVQEPGAVLKVLSDRAHKLQVPSPHYHFLSPTTGMGIIALMPLGARACLGTKGHPHDEGQNTCPIIMDVCPDTSLIPTMLGRVLSDDKASGSVVQDPHHVMLQGIHTHESLAHHSSLFPGNMSGGIEHQHEDDFPGDYIEDYF